MKKVAVSLENTYVCMLTNKIKKEITINKKTTNINLFS